MAKYYCILFDADNTLLNFDAAENKALAETLVNYGIEPDAETVQTYRTINEELWRQLEKGQIRREKLFSERFSRFLKTIDAAGDGVEMTPFHNISKEWYAAQTSKKIRAVWQAKADNGRRVSSAVPFGHMKDPNDKEKWLIDEPAAKAVRKIHALCLAGRGASQIARQLEKEQILIINASTDYMRKR